MPNKERAVHWVRERERLHRHQNTATNRCRVNAGSVTRAAELVLLFLFLSFLPSHLFLLFPSPFNMRVHLPVTTRSVGFLLTVSCFAMYSYSFIPFRELWDGLPSMNIFSSHPGISAVVPQMPMNSFIPRQGVSVSVPQNNSPTPASSPTSSSSSTPQEKSTSSSTTQSSTTQQPSSSSTPPSTQQSSSTTPTSTQSTNTPASSTTPHSSIPPVTSAILTTDQGGQTITSIVVISDAASSSSTPTQSSGPASPPSSSSSGVSSSTIIGLSVAGGVAILGIIGFFVWKFTRKQRNEFNDSTCFSPFPLLRSRLMLIDCAIFDRRRDKMARA